MIMIESLRDLASTSQVCSGGIPGIVFRITGTPYHDEAYAAIIPKQPGEPSRIGRRVCICGLTLNMTARMDPATTLCSAAKRIRE